MKSLLIALVLLFSAFGNAQDKINVRPLHALHKEKSKKISNDTAQVNSLLKIAGWHLKAMSRSEYKRSAYSFEREEPLGEGAYGAVFSGYDLDRRIAVAVKIYHGGSMP